MATHGGESIEDDSNFEVTSKSKAHRKIRVNKETFGGDVMIPRYSLFLFLFFPQCIMDFDESSHQNNNMSLILHMKILEACGSM